MLEKMINECLLKQGAAYTLKFQGLDMIGDANTVLKRLDNVINDVLVIAEAEIHKRFDNLLGANKMDDAQAAVNAFSILHHDQ